MEVSDPSGSSHHPLRYTAVLVYWDTDYQHKAGTSRIRKPRAFGADTPKARGIFIGFWNKSRSDRRSHPAPGSRSPRLPPTRPTGPNWGSRYRQESRDEREKLETYWTDQESFDRWIEKELAYYADAKLQDKEVEVLSDLERIQRRNELDRQMLEKMKKAAEENGDQE